MTPLNSDYIYILVFFHLCTYGQSKVMEYLFIIFSCV